jgi:hypothetical protein
MPDCSILATLDTFGYLAGIPLQSIYLEADAGIEAFEKGLPLLQERTRGIPLSAPYTTPIIKYGHLHELGLGLSFPKEGQVAPDHSTLSLSAVAELLTEKEVFGNRDLTRSQVAYHRKMKQHFSGSRVHFGWQWEGPLTTLWALMGSEFFTAFYDEPEAVQGVLTAVAAHIRDYVIWYCSIDGTGSADPFPDYGRICDDLAAMISPAMWPKYVEPAWNLLFSSALARKTVHCEGMSPDHLESLERMGVRNFDPGISPRLNPAILQSGLSSVPFCWRLGSFHYQSMSMEDIVQFVCHAFNDGAVNIFTVFEPLMCTDETIEKVRTFFTTAEACQDSDYLNKTLDPRWAWSQWKGFSGDEI